MNMLQIRNVAAGYGSIQVLWDISLDVGQDEIACLIGSNGAGKTTLLRTISGLIAAWQGSIEFEGAALQHLPVHEVVEHRISHVPEGRRLFRTMSVRENLLMGAYRIHDRGAHKEDLERAYTLFPVLAERRNQACGTLSGGEQQMCAIARGLMSRPKLLLIDELSLGLAPRIVDMLAKTLRQIREFGISVLLVEQDVALAFDLASRAFLLDGGRIALAGSTAEIADHPMIKQAYLGG
jgi:branched-chain amino acid transport system ATP-binding protein